MVLLQKRGFRGLLTIACITFAFAETGEKTIGSIMSQKVCQKGAERPVGLRNNKPTIAKLISFAVKQKRYPQEHISRSQI